MNLKRLLFFILVLAMCLISTNLYAQDSLNITCINQDYHNWIAGPEDVCIRGNFAYLACNQAGLRIIDISDLASPIDMGHYNLGLYQQATAIEVEGGRAFLGIDEGIIIIDISNPLHPEQLGFVSLDGRKMAIKADQNYVYVCRVGGLAIVNAADPVAASVIWTSSDIGLARDIEIHANIAYVSCNGQGLRVMDISNKTDPLVTNVFDFNNDGEVTGATVSGGYAFMSCGEMGFNILDLSTMQIVSGIDSLAYSTSVKVIGNYAYVAYFIPECPLAIVDISNPLSPQTLGVYQPPTDLAQFDIAGGIAYIADCESGLRMVDISDPYNPHEDYYFNRCGSDFGVLISGDYAFVQDYSCVRIYDISDMRHPLEVSRYDIVYRIEDMIIEGNILYLVGYDNIAIYAIDISIPSSPDLLGTFSVPSVFQHSRIAIYDHYAYLAHYSGICIVDIADPRHMIQSGFVTVSLDSPRFAIKSHYLYLTDNYNRVRILNLANPTAPAWIGSYNLGEFCMDLKIKGDLLYALTIRKLKIFDANCFAGCAPLCNITLLGDGINFPNNMTISNQYVYIADDSIGLRVYDATNPSAPQLAGYYHTPGISYGVSLKNQVAVVADYNNLGFYDCSMAVGVDEPSRQPVPQAFALLPNYPNPFNSSTQIQFELGKQEHVTLSVFDLLGRNISTIANGEFAVGRHTVRWDGTSADGKTVSSGRYFVQAKTSETSKTIPIMLLK
jgi:hypothetical protein